MASNDEFYASAANKRLNQLDAERLRAQHDLAVSLSQGDEDAAAGEIDTIAEIDAKRANLIQLAQREVARQNPPQQAPQTDQEFLSKSPERMNPRSRMMISTVLIPLLVSWLMFTARTVPRGCAPYWPS
jgi:hypothetical protein